MAFAQVPLIENDINPRFSQFRCGIGDPRFGDPGSSNCKKRTNEDCLFGVKLPRYLP